MQGSGISSADRIINIRTVEKYNSPIAFTSAMTSFRLPVDTNRARFSDKPLYLIIPFYIFYFLTLLIIVVAFTWFVYFIVTKIYLVRNERVKKRFHVISKIANSIFDFFNSLTLLVVLLLVNLFLQQRIMLTDNWNWINASFCLSLISYVLIQLVIVFMFTSTYKDDIANHIKRIYSSNEFKYYERIGVCDGNRYYIYNKKYGRILLLKHIFQNILFVFNINLFLSYAFNKWTQFDDLIGITYAISFENIFTKILALRPDTAEIYNFAILGVINVLLFSLYYYYQKKLSSGQK